MTAPLLLRIRNAIDAMAPAHAAAMAWLEQNQVPPGTGVLASLAIDELVTNCIKYAYDDADEHVIDVELRLDEDRLVLRVSDDGRPFNPLDAAAPDLSLPIEERPVGGLGLYLLRTIADEMTYERRDGRNCLTLVKSVHETPE